MGKPPPHPILDSGLACLPLPVSAECRNGAWRILVHRIRIVVLDRGRVAQCGTRAEPLARGGLHARLDALQRAA